MFDTFNVDPTCLVLITNWFAPKDHPHWHEDEDGGCTFEFCGTMQNTAHNANRVLHVHAKKNRHLRVRIRTDKHWKDDDDILGGVIRKYRKEANVLRNKKDDAQKTAFFKSLLNKVDKIEQEPDEEESAAVYGVA